MNRRKRLFLVIVLLLSANAAFAAAFQADPEEVRAKFAEKWLLYFGDPCPAVATETKTGQSAESVFRELWGQCSASLDAQDRPAAESAMRYRLLGDKRNYLLSLRNCMASRIFSPPRNGEMLYYIFLEEEIEEKTVIPMALPPGENGRKFHEAFEQLGEDGSKIRTRLAAFIFRKLIEEKLLKSLRNELPLIWFYTKGFAPSEAVYGRIILSDGNPYIKGEFNEESASLKLISVLTDLSGKIIRIGIGNPADGQMLIPADDNVLHLMLFNPGLEENGRGMSGTVWKDYSIPVSVDDASLSGQYLRMTVQESGCVLGYTLVGSEDGATDSELDGFPFVRSLGEGAHAYFFAIPPGQKVPGRLSLKAHTFSGFTFPVPISLEK